MESDAADTAKHKKARVGREGFDARAMTPARAVRLALGKAADTEMDLVLSVSTVEQEDVSQAGLNTALGEGGLLILLEGERGRRGAVRIDMAFLVSVIEHQTTGRIASHAVDPRRLTRTDAAMVAPLMDAVFERVEANLADQPGGEAWHGFRFGAMIEDMHGLALALEADRYHLMRLSVALGDGGARTGMIEFLVPEAAELQAPGTPVGPGTDDASAVLGQLALDAPVVLRATMGQVDVTLDAALALSEGDVLTVSGCNGLMVRLEGTEGHLVAEARLGQVNGQRAVRLTTGPDRGTGQDGPHTVQPSRPAMAPAPVPQVPQTIATGPIPSRTIEHMPDIQTGPAADAVGATGQVGVQPPGPMPVPAVAPGASAAALPTQAAPATGASAPGADMAISDTANVPVTDPAA